MHITKTKSSFISTHISGHNHQDDKTFLLSRGLRSHLPDGYEGYRNSPAGPKPTCASTMVEPRKGRRTSAKLCMKSVYMSITVLREQSLVEIAVVAMAYTVG